MNHNKYIKGIIPGLVREFQNGIDATDDTREYFKDANPEIVIDAINKVRNLRRDDGSDGNEKYYQMHISGMTRDFRQQMDDHIAGLDSKLLLLWRFLENKLEKSELAKVSESERAFILDEVIHPDKKFPRDTRKRNDLYGRILGITPSKVPDKLNPKTGDKHKAESYIRRMGL